MIRSRVVPALIALVVVLAAAAWLGLGGITRGADAAHGGRDALDARDAGPGSATLARDAYAPVVANVATVADALDTRAPATAKGRLLHGLLQKKTEQKLAAAGVVEVVAGGDPGLAAALKKKVPGAHFVKSSDRGYSLSLRSESGNNPDGTHFVRCSAALAEMPRMRLVGSLTDKADADDPKDARDACASALAGDVASWLRSKRN